MLHINEVREPAPGDGARHPSRFRTHRQGGQVRSAKPSEVAAQAAEIKKLEEEGDALYHEAVGALFAGRPDRSK